MGGLLSSRRHHATEINLITMIIRSLNEWALFLNSKILWALSEYLVELIPMIIVPHYKNISEDDIHVA